MLAERQARLGGASREVAVEVELRPQRRAAAHQVGLAALGVPDPPRPPRAPGARPRAGTNSTPSSSPTTRSLGPTSCSPTRADVSASGRTRIHPQRSGRAARPVLNTGRPIARRSAVSRCSPQTTMPTIAGVPGLQRHEVTDCARGRFVRRCRPRARHRPSAAHERLEEDVDAPDVPRRQHPAEELARRERRTDLGWARTGPERRPAGSRRRGAPSSGPPPGRAAAVTAPPPPPGARSRADSTGSSTAPSRKHTAPTNVPEVHQREVGRARRWTRT